MGLRPWEILPGHRGLRRARWFLRGLRVFLEQGSAPSAGWRGRVLQREFLAERHDHKLFASQARSAHGRATATAGLDWTWMGEGGTPETAAERVHDTALPRSSVDAVGACSRVEFLPGGGQEARVNCFQSSDFMNDISIHSM